MNLDNIDVEEINVNQIQEIHYQRLKKRVGVFDKVLKQCYRVIKQTVSKEEQWCIYTIPEIMFGNPLYNIPDCANYIYRSLKKNGFTVKYIFPNHLVIMWSYKNSGRAMLEYPTVDNPGSSITTTLKSLPPSQNKNSGGRGGIGYGSGSGVSRSGGGFGSGNSVSSSTNNQSNIGIDIFKRNNNNNRNLNQSNTHSTKEFKPSGMFLFNKKR